MKKSSYEVYILCSIIAVISYFQFRNQSLMPLIVMNIIIIIIFSLKYIKEDIFNIAVLFLINYSIYIMYIPFKLLTGNITEKYYELVWDRGLGVQILLICGVLSIVPFCIGFNLGKVKIRKKEKKLTKIKIYVSKLFKYRIVYLIFEEKIIYSAFIISGLILFGLGIYKQGGLEFLLSIYQWDSNKTSEIGLMTTGIQLFLVGISISFYSYLLYIKNENKKLNILKWKGLYLFIIVASIKFLQGGRIQILMGMVTLAALYHYTYKKIKIKFVLILTLVGYAMLGYVGYFRDYKTLIPKDIGTMATYMIGGSGGLEYFLNSYTIYTTMYVINTVKITYLWGLSLFDGFVFIIPRFIFNNKDNFMFINKKISELNSVQIISPVGGLNLAAQNLMNGNIIYSIVFMFLLGYIFSIIYRYKDSSVDGILLYCLIIPILVVSLVRNPIFYTIKELIEFCVVPYLLIIFSRMRGKYEKDLL